MHSFDNKEREQEPRNMVYLIQNDQRNATVYQSAIAGGASGAITRALAQPLDVLKIRFQLQLEPIKKGSKYSSIVQACADIIKEERLATLWSGHIPAQFLSISYGILQFSSFEMLIQRSQVADPQFFIDNKHWINFTCGSVAATIATVASFPFDTIRTRLIAEEKTCKAYKGFYNALVTMFKTEGPMSLYKGMFPTLAQIAPHAGIQFVVYKLFTENIFNRIEYFKRSVGGSKGTVVEATLSANLVAGSIAGFVAKTVIYPFDLVKKRLQIQGFQQHRRGFGKQMYCSGSIDCLKLTISEEGFLALYKGFGPSVVKAVLVSALHFAVYDEIKHFLIRT